MISLMRGTTLALSLRRPLAAALLTAALLDGTAARAEAACKKARSRPDEPGSSAALMDRPRAPRHLDVFVDPLAPFAAGAEEELFGLLARSAIKDLTLSMHYLVQESASGSLTSPRGEAGVRESLRQACLFHAAPFVDFVAYRACRGGALDGTGDSCAPRDARLQECVEKGQGERLLRADARLARELGVRTSIALLWENRRGPFGWHDAAWRRLLEESQCGD